MPILTITSPKGGVGKSSTALTLGTTLARHGASVCLFDCDPNKTLVNWRKGSSRSPLEVIDHSDQSTVARALRAAATRVNFVICDLDGSASTLAASATLCADLIIIPSQASAVDATQARRAIEFITDQASAVGPRPFRVLMTRTKPGFATRDEKLIRKAMLGAGVPMFKTDLSERAPYRSQFTYKLAVHELDESLVNGCEKAVSEADAFAVEVTNILRVYRAAA